MNLHLKKEQLLNLSEDTLVIPLQLTPQVAGGNTLQCHSPVSSECPPTETTATIRELLTAAC